MILTLNNLSEMIREAMRVKAPQMFKELTEDGTLDRVIHDRAEAALETEAELRHQAREQAVRSKASEEEKLQMHFRGNYEAKQTAIAQATEFPYEMPPTDSIPKMRPFTAADRERLARIDEQTIAELEASNRLEERRMKRLEANRKPKPE